ncbi:MAG: carboxypeptidase regulatory-like domain-containing protein [Labilithrix sp.]|nr:carboxypeptidase regulatory-like domain-containing protein [Labilithrix sp.]
MSPSPHKPAFVLVALVIAACGSAVTREVPPDDTSTAPPAGRLPEPGAGCTGLRCDVPTCAAGTTTAIEGDVYDPAGKAKLYGAIAYVPNAALEPLATGATCDRCGAVSGDPIAAALTDERGRFRIENVPAGKDVPVVIQVGKWRRTIVVPSVEACATTVIKDGDAHLPRNTTEGDLPQIAVVTGGFDELGCLLSRIGVDGAEYGGPSSKGRIHVYRGVGGGDTTAGGAPPATALWNDVSTLSKYDMVLLACEGWEYDEDDQYGNKTAAAKSAMREYAARGGRIFATHYHYTWFKQSSPDFHDVATWNEPSSAYGKKTLSVDTSFPKGAAFAKWLSYNGASSTPGLLDVENPGSNVEAVNAKAAQRWLYTDSPKNVAYMSFNVPIGAPPEEQCGRAVFSDVHVSGEQGSLPLPGHCGAAKLTPQELALEFLLFDLAACVQPDAQVPAAPVVK